ncbi:MAG: amidohydrolase family protein, partial [Marinicellaceae bacterium]
MQKLTLTRPDDWHIHLRDGLALETTVKDVASQFSRAIVMPNLNPPVTNVSLAQKYKNNIQKQIPKALKFEPLMTLYLTDNTSANDIEQAMQTDFIKACKLYPAGATTNSDSGLSQIENAYPVFDAMQKLGMPLLIHGEVTDSD